MNINKTRNPATYVAIDLGSNTFHLLAAQYQDQRLAIVDCFRDSVNLLGGISETGSLSTTARLKAASSLAKIAERLHGFDQPVVRAIGTHGMRKLSDPLAALGSAGAAIGCPIEVIGAQEEARLSFLGISQAFPQGAEHCLMLDIGGGSTEIGIGSQNKTYMLDSTPVGCLTLANHFFKGGHFSADLFDQAIEHARWQLAPMMARTSPYAVRTVFATAGSTRSALACAKLIGRTEDAVSKETVKILIGMLCDTENNMLEQVARFEKLPTLAGGLCMLMAAMESLDTTHVQHSAGGLQEGIIYDLIAREQDLDPRRTSIDQLARRYDVDQAHARSMTYTLRRVFPKLSDHFGLSQQHLMELEWCAMVHECGRSIAVDNQSQHTDYVLKNSYLPGFSQYEQNRLASIIQQNQAAARLTAHSNAEAADQIIQRSLFEAVSVLHTERPEQPPQIEVLLEKDRCRLLVTSQWINQHPNVLCALQQLHRQPRYANQPVMIGVQGAK